MAETISTVGFILDVLVLGFILYLHFKKDDRTWTQKLGASMMCWFLVCHAFMHLVQFLPTWNLWIFDDWAFTMYGGEERDIVGTIVAESLWKVAITGFVVAMLITPMPLVKNANLFFGGICLLLVLFLWESYYTWGHPSQEADMVWFWPFWSGVPALMLLFLTYLSWNYLSSPEGAETRMESFTDRAGLFAVLAVILWAGKNWFDWMGIFNDGSFFYWDGMPGEGWLHFLADGIGKFEQGMIIFPLMVLSVGSVIYLRNRGSWLLGGIILSFLLLGIAHDYMFGGDTPDYGVISIFVNEDSFAESFALLTHGTMQSLARPLIVLFIVVRFGMVQTQHSPVVSRAMTIMALAGAMSVITEILQPMFGVPQLLSGFFLGAILAFEIERKIMAAMEPPEEENPDWELDGCEGDELHRRINIAMGAYLLLTFILALFISRGELFI